MPLRVFHTHQFFNVSFRAFGLESGRTSRLKPGERVLKSRSESTTYAHPPDTDSADHSTPYYSSSRSVSPSMSNTNANQPQNQTQSNQPTSLQNNVQPNFFNHPLVYPQVPTQVYGGHAPNPPTQPLYTAVPLQDAMYSQAQMLQMMTNMQQLLRNTSFCTYVRYKNKK